MAESCEATAFQRCFSLLQNGLQHELSTIAPILFTKSLISSENRDKSLSGIKPPHERASHLLSVLESRIRVDPASFHSIVRELGSYPTLQVLATKLQSELEQIRKERERQQRSPTELQVPPVYAEGVHGASASLTTSSQPACVFSTALDVQQQIASLEASVSVLKQPKESEEAIDNVFARENLCQIRHKFAQLKTLVYSKIKARFEAGEFSMDVFLIYVTNLFPPGKCFPKSANQISDIFTVITENGLCDYSNYTPLKRIANTYGGGDSELRDTIDRYVQDLNGYKVATTMQQYIAHSQTPVGEEMMLQPSSTKKDECYLRELTLKLKVRVTGKSLMYVDELWNCLGDHFIFPPATVILDRILEGSVYITWLVSFFLVPLLVEKVKLPAAAEFFKKHRIVAVLVDGVPVYKEPEEQVFIEEEEEKKEEEEERPHTAEKKMEKEKGKEEEEEEEEEGEEEEEEEEEEEGEEEEEEEGEKAPKKERQLQRQMTGYPCEPVSKTEGILCPVCLLVLRNPVQVTCCGKRYCQGCIERVMSMRKPCPLCNATYEYFPDIAHRQVIVGLLVYCSNKQHGCKWQGELCNLQQHLNSHPRAGREEIGCWFASIRCIHCNEYLPRRHMQDCPQRPYTCPYCYTYESTYEDVTNSHMENCPGQLFFCPYCTYESIHEDVTSSHMQGCPQRPYTCPYCFIYESTYEKVTNDHLKVCEEYEVPCSQCGVLVEQKNLMSHTETECVKTLEPLHRPLGSDDYMRIVAVLSPVSSKWLEIGVELGVDAHHLDQITNDDTIFTDRGYFTCMLRRLLKTQSLSWEDIAQTLESERVGESELAETIRQENSALNLEYDPTPTLEELANIKVACWSTLGKILGINVYELLTVQYQMVEEDDETRKMTMFRMWLRASQNPTWRKLVQALACSVYVQDKIEAAKIRHTHGLGELTES